VLERWETAAGRILVIDDDSAVRRVLNRLFELEGYTMDLAGDGIKGLELFRRTMPSAVLLDLLLPDISGEEICHTIAQLAPGLRPERKVRGRGQSRVLEDGCLGLCD
jgi:CheY-like chemotaxis protein